MSEKSLMGVQQIKELIPHRYPFLLLDTVEELTEASVTATKCVSGGELIFQGHFPDYPIFPGVMSVEAIAQASAVWASSHYGFKDGELGVFMSIERAKFRKPIVPGDKMEIKVDITYIKKKYFKAKGVITVDGVKCVEADITVGLKRT